MSVENAERINGAVILAAGNGTRMRPATRAVPKPLLPVYNRPVVDYSVEDALRAGINRIIFVADKKAEPLLREQYGDEMSPENYVAERHNLPQLTAIKELGRPIFFEYVEQDLDEGYGTGKGAAKCADKIGGGRLVVTTGDDFVYNPMGRSAISQLLEGVAAQGATAGLLTVEVSDEQVARYGIVEGDGVFERILEGPQPHETDSRRANVSTYLIDSDPMAHVVEIGPSPPKGEYLIVDAFNAYRDKGNRLAVVPAEGQFLDSGEADDYVDTHIAVREGVWAQQAA